MIAKKIGQKIFFGEMRFQQKEGICGLKFQNSELIFWLRAGKPPQLGEKFLKIRLKTGPSYGKRALIAKKLGRKFSSVR